MISTSFIIVPSYFERRRGLANALMMAGTCIGQILGPLLIRLLQDEYGYRGATLVLGAILSNVLIGTAFFHPVEWHLKKTHQHDISPRQDSSPDKRTGEEESNPSEEQVEWASLVTQARSRGEDGSVTTEAHETHPLVVAPRRGGGSSELWIRVGRSILSDLGILKSPRALIIALGSCCFIIGYYNFLMMVPFAMQTAGHSLADAANCISASAVTNLSLRLLASALSDCAWFNMRAVYMTGLALTSASIFGKVEPKLTLPVVDSPRYFPLSKHLNFAAIMTELCSQ